MTVTRGVPGVSPRGIAQKMCMFLMPGLPTLGSYPNSSGQNKCSWLSIQTLLNSVLVAWNTSGVLLSSAFQRAFSHSVSVSDGAKSFADEGPEIGRCLEN